MPPLLVDGVRAVKRLVFPRKRILSQPSASVTEQDLSVYWNEEMAMMLETWGESNVWKELPLLMVNCPGKVLDIACGTGKTMGILASLPLDVHGCDISDMLIAKAVERGIAEDHLTICDATDMPYADNSFDYAYSIGSLEHFTESGIVRLLAECRRTVRHKVFHMVPVSRSGLDEGWLKTQQSFHNNSVAWWMDKFSSAYTEVRVLDSTWEDQISVGKWFVCSNRKDAHVA